MASDDIEELIMRAVARKRSVDEDAIDVIACRRGEGEDRTCPVSHRDRSGRSDRAVGARGCDDLMRIDERIAEREVRKTRRAEYFRARGGSRPCREIRPCAVVFLCDKV